jgi:hypothetical protein
MHRLGKQKCRGEIYIHDALPVRVTDGIQRALTGDTRKVHDMIESTEFAEHARDERSDRGFVGDIQTRDRERCTTRDFGEREVGGDKAHAALAKARYDRTSKTTGRTRHERDRRPGSRCL